MKTCNKLVRDTLEISRRLIILADEGEGRSDDDGCFVLCGVIRDCAYRIRAQAEREREAHRLRGVWDCFDRFPVIPGGTGAAGEL